MPPSGLEPLANSLGNCCSIHLSYGGVGACERIITLRRYDYTPRLKPRLIPWTTPPTERSTRRQGRPPFPSACCRELQALLSEHASRSAKGVSRCGPAPIRSSGPTPPTSGRRRSGTARTDRCRTTSRHFLRRSRGVFARESLKFREASRWERRPPLSPRLALCWRSRPRDKPGLETRGI